MHSKNHIDQPVSSEAVCRGFCLLKKQPRCLHDSVRSERSLQSTLQAEKAAKKILNLARKKSAEDSASKREAV
jgi:hypothetical protein